MVEKPVLGNTANIETVSCYAWLLFCPKRAASMLWDTSLTQADLLILQNLCEVTRNFTQ